MGSPFLRSHCVGRAPARRRELACLDFYGDLTDNPAPNPPFADERSYKSPVNTGDGPSLDWIAAPRSQRNFAPRSRDSPTFVRDDTFSVARESRLRVRDRQLEIAFTSPRGCAAGREDISRFGNSPPSASPASPPRGVARGVTIIPRSREGGARRRRGG